MSQTRLRSVGAFESLTSWVLKHRTLVIVATLGATAASAIWVPKLTFDVSLAAFLDPDDKDLVLSRSLNERFGMSAYAFLAYRDPQLFTPVGVARLARLTEQISQLPHVERADALTSLRLVSGDATTIRVRPLAQPLPTTQLGVDALKRRALAQRNIRGNLLSDDGTVTAIAVQLVHSAEHSDEYALATVPALRRLAKQILPAGTQAFLAGMPVFYQEMQRSLRRDRFLLFGAAIGLIVLLLALLTRSVIGVVLPVVVVICTTCVTLGLMAASGTAMSLGSVMLPPLIMVIGCANVVHVISAVRHRLTEQPPDAPLKPLIAKAMGRVGMALLLTSATTAAGFVSLQVATVRTVRQFGLFSAIAISVALLLSLTFVPAILSLWRPPALRGKAGADESADGSVDAAPRSLIGRLLGVTSAVSRRPGAVVGGSVIVCALVAIGVGRLPIETGFRHQFLADNPVLRGLDFVEAHLTGTDTLRIVIDTPQRGGVLNPAVLAGMRKLQDQLLREKGVRQVRSLADVLGDARQVLDPSIDPASYVPASRAEAAQLLLLVEGERQLLARVVDNERKQTVVTASLDSMPTSATRDLVARLAPKIATLQSQGVRYRISGPAYMMQRLVNDVIDSLVWSFALAFVTIFIMIAIALRSVSLAALSMIPNLLPIACMIGLMGWLGIPLNDVTLMTASIAIGIAVDDTIHYLVAYRLAQAQGASSEVAIRRTSAEVGRAIVTTSIVLAAGFGALALASFKPPIFFGLLSAITIVVALAADLLVLPALLALRARWQTSRTRRRDAAEPLRPSSSRAR
ncbi:MAG: MMPL family transporter [Deltaproteobacteria bacterium]|nr:MMPL family transporter [Deltaproteobacteria bacterium]